MLGRRRRVRRRRLAVAGGAAIVAKRRRDANEAQQEEAATAQAESGQPDQAVEPAADVGLSEDAMDQLKQLGELHEENVLTDAEFSSARRQSC